GRARGGRRLPGGRPGAPSGGGPGPAGGGAGPWLPASVTGGAWRNGGRYVLKESLVRLGHSGAVPGSEQVQQQAADHRDAEAGVGSGRPFVGPGLDQGGGDRGGP